MAATTADRGHVSAARAVGAEAAEITGVILCGGRGHRMGDVEKPLQLLHGRPLVQHVRDSLTPQVGRVIISANRERARYAEFGHDVVPDASEGLGPLGGLGSAAAHVRTPWIFCCPGDAPLLDRTLVPRLMASVSEAHDGAVPHDGERAQHLFLLVRTHRCQTIAAQLAAGHRSVHAWLTTLRVHHVPMPELSASFCNVNTRHELAQLHSRSDHATAERDRTATHSGATRRTPDRPADTWPPRQPR